MSRKREKPYNSRHLPYSYPKRRRPQPTVPPPLPTEEPPKQKPAPPPAVVVIGLPEDCSVLDLKSKFEIFGPISRIRIDPQCVGFISFRSIAAAQSALSSSISFHSHPVQVMWASEMNGESGDGEERDRLNSNSNSYSSKLLKGEPPLSRHGRGNRLSSAIVNPNSTGSSTAGSGSSSSSVLDPSFKAREIVAYDDLF